MLIVFDIGGTAIKYGVISSFEKPLFLYQEEVESNAKVIKGMGIINKIKKIIKENLQQYAIEGIAISTAGMVDANQGKIIYANENIPEYTGICIKAILEKEFNIPCWVENDVNAAALGETIYGAGKKSDYTFMVTVGTGVGGAIVLHHEVYHGFSNSAGEIGYMLLNNQYFEKSASTSALIQSVETIKKENGIDGKKIFYMAKQGDEICIKMIDILCEQLVKGISNCICLLNPQIVILGGGIMSQKDYLREIINRYMKKYLNSEMQKNTKIEFAELGNQAGMIGAYVYWLKKERKI